MIIWSSNDIKAWIWSPNCPNENNKIWANEIPKTGYDVTLSCILAIIYMEIFRISARKFFKLRCFFFAWVSSHTQYTAVHQKFYSYCVQQCTVVQCRIAIKIIRLLIFLQTSSWNIYSLPYIYYWSQISCHVIKLMFFSLYMMI